MTKHALWNVLVCNCGS